MPLRERHECAIVMLRMTQPSQKAGATLWAISLSCAGCGSLVKISKYLSCHLRHRSGLLGLELADGAWVEVEKLLTAANQNKFSLNLAELKTVVEQNDKQRFSFDSTGKLIRANQGHSVAIDIGLKSQIPPAILYHGTYERALEPIFQQGLNKMQRHHVHLSSDRDTAIKVGHRRDKE